jgi:hypothetical protein
MAMCTKAAPVPCCSFATSAPDFDRKISLLFSSSPSPWRQLWHVTYVMSHAAHTKTCHCSPDSVGLCQDTAHFDLGANVCATTRHERELWPVPPAAYGPCSAKWCHEGAAEIASHNRAAVIDPAVHMVASHDTCCCMPFQTSNDKTM